MKRWELFLYAKKITITTLFNNLSILRHRITILENIRWMQTVYAGLWHQCLTDTFSTLIYTFFFFFYENSVFVWCSIQRIFSKTKCWIKLLFLFYLRKKSVLITSLNSDWTTDGRWTILTMSFILFWPLTVLFTWELMVQSQATVFIQNILNCVPKMNKDFTGLEQHGGKLTMTKLSFWSGVAI